MNKKIIFSIICGLILTVGATSCKKNQSCTCTTTETDLIDGTYITYTNPNGTKTIKDTKKKAKTECEKSNSTVIDDINDIKYETKCEIN